MFYYLQAILRVFHRPTMVDPAKCLLDPNSDMRTDYFLCLYMSWALTVCCDPHDSDSGHKILSKFQVVSITHSKVPYPPEHEFILIETLDHSDQTTRHFILERMITTVTSNHLASDRSHAHSAKLLDRLKKIAKAVIALISGSSELSILEEGTSTAMSSTNSLSLQVVDQTTLASTESMDIVSESLEKSKDTRIQALDRFLGQDNLSKRRFHGKVVQYFKPNDLTLFQFSLIAHNAHDLYPTYSSFGDQCYFYAGLVYAAAKEIGGVHPSINADVSQDDDMVYTIDSHLGKEYGRWNGIKVKDVDPSCVRAVVGKYKESQTRYISEVSVVL